jgi:predicted TIM-barrel fold metal-dependent hydrolase
MGRHPNAYAKLSNTVLGSKQDYPFKDMHGPTKEIIKAFTPERCIWGSDFPCELWCPKVGTYGRHLKLFTEEMGLDRPTQEAILGRTPHRLFFAGYAAD